MSTEAEARRQRPLMSGLVALAVALAAAIGWYYLARPDESARPVPTITVAELSNLTKSGRADGKLLTVAPSELPRGWSVRTAEYQSGVSPRWRIALSNANGRFVGLIESRDTTTDILDQFVNGEAIKDGEVAVGGETWQVWTAKSGDYALVRTAETPNGEQERILVVGTAPDAEIRDFAATLSADALPN